MKVSHKDFAWYFLKTLERNCSLSSVYLGCNKVTINSSIFIKTVYFVVKYLALIIASWTLICCPIIGNHLVLGSRSSVQNMSKKRSVEHVFSRWIYFYNSLSLGELHRISDTLYVWERTRWKILVFTSVVYLCDFYERDIARQKEFDIILQKLLDHDRAQGFKQSNKRIAKMNNANK